MYIDKIHNVQQILMCLKLCFVPVSVWGASVCLLCFDVCCVFLFVVCVLLLCSCVCLCFLVLLLISVVFVIFWFFVFSCALCLFLFGVPLYRYAWTHHVMLSCMGCTVGRVLALYHNELPESLGPTFTHLWVDIPASWRAIVLAGDTGGVVGNLPPP